jgi:T4-like virus tail tube protein gp19
MPQKIVDFLHNFKSDLAKPSRFEVSITTPKGLTSTPTNLMYRCESAELPSRTYATLEQKFGSNPIEKYPYQVQFNDLTLTFMVSTDMSEKKYFDSWMELIVPSDTYNMKFKESYITDITITQFSSGGEPTYAVKLIDAYPITVNQLDLDWSSDGYHKLTVVFAYTYWEAINPSSEIIINETPGASVSKISAEQDTNKTPGATISKISAEQDTNKTPDRATGPIFIPLIR